MTQLSQLSEAEIEARFHITGARPVGFLLAGYAKEAVQFSIQFGAGADLFLTTLLVVIPERNLLIFDCSGSQDMNRRLLASDRALFVGRPGGIHVQFAVGRVQETIYGGARALAVALPAHVVRLQDGSISGSRRRVRSRWSFSGVWVARRYACRHMIFRSSAWL